MGKDPVCGMQVNPEQVTDKSDYQGETYYFCCAHCKEQFDQNPERYAAERHAEAQRT